MLSGAVGCLGCCVAQHAHLRMCCLACRHACMHEYACINEVAYHPVHGCALTAWHAYSRPGLCDSSQS